MEILNWNLEIQWQRFRNTQVERTTNNNNGSDLKTPLPNYNNDTTLEKADRERITKFVLTC